MGGKEKLLGVQYLRAIAALMVAYYHLTLWVAAYTGALTFKTWINTSHFAGAVPVFFVISGFVMYVSAIESSPSRFVSRRLQRIVPLYWCLTLLMALMLWSHHSDISVHHLMRSLLFVQSLTNGMEVYPVLIPGWSLNYEMLFYGLFACALLLSRWRMAAILAALVAAAIFLHNYQPWLLGLFGAGLIIGWAYRNGAVNAGPWLSATLCVAGLFALVGTGVPAFVRHEVAPVSIVLGAVSLDFAGATPMLPSLEALGDASYSLYLVHFFAFDAVLKFWPHLTGAFAAWMFAALSLGTAICFAFTTHHLIERPALRLFSRRLTVQIPSFQQP